MTPSLWATSRDLLAGIQEAVEVPLAKGGLRIASRAFDSCRVMETTSDDGRSDGRHLEWRDETAWRALDEELA